MHDSTSKSRGESETNRALFNEKAAPRARWATLSKNDIYTSFFAKADVVQGEVAIVTGPKAPSCAARAARAAGASRGPFRWLGERAPSTPRILILSARFLGLAFFLLVSLERGGGKEEDIGTHSVFLEVTTSQERKESRCPTPILPQWSARRSDFSSNWATAGTDFRSA